MNLSEFLCTINSGRSTIVSYILNRKYYCALCKELQAKIEVEGISALKSYNGMICAGIEDMLLKLECGENIPEPVKLDSLFD